VPAIARRPQRGRIPSLHCAPDDFDRTTSTDYWSGSYSVETNSVLHNAYDVSLDWYTLSPSGSASAVPEPAAALLMLAGAGRLATQRRKAAARA